MKKIIIFVVTICLLISSALAEDVWILCKPDSYVNIRQFASKKQDPVGRMECGWQAETEGESKNGYLLIYTSSTEEGCGWIKKGYITYSKPVIITLKTNIYSKGRVACWKAIGGNRRCWVKNGDCITAYAISEEWSITNKGYIKTKYLGVNYDILLNAELEEGQTNTESTDLHWEDE